MSQTFLFFFSFVAVLALIGLAAWLASGARAAGDPTRFVLGDRSAASTSIDWDALIQAQVNAKLAQATTIQTSITANQAKISAYQNLQTLLSTLATATTSLSNSIVNSLSTSVFGTRAATITSTGDVSASSALSMSIGNGAATGEQSEGDGPQPPGRHPTEAAVGEPGSRAGRSGAGAHGANHALHAHGVSSMTPPGGLASARRKDC